MSGLGPEERGGLAPREICSEGQFLFHSCNVLCNYSKKISFLPRPPASQRKAWADETSKDLRSRIAARPRSGRFQRTLATKKALTEATVRTLSSVPSVCSLGPCFFTAPSS